MKWAELVKGKPEEGATGPKESTENLERNDQPASEPKPITDKPPVSDDKPESTSDKPKEGTEKASASPVGDIAISAGSEDPSKNSSVAEAPAPSKFAWSKPTESGQPVSSGVSWPSLGDSKTAPPKKSSEPLILSEPVQDEKKKRGGKEGKKRGQPINPMPAKARVEVTSARGGSQKGEKAEGSTDPSVTGEGKLTTGGNQDKKTPVRFSIPHRYMLECLGSH